MIWIVVFATGIAGMLLSLWGAHRQRRRGMERLISHLRADETTLEKTKGNE